MVYCGSCCLWWEPYNLHTKPMGFVGWISTNKDPAQRGKAAGQDLDDLSVERDPSVRRVRTFPSQPMGDFTVTCSRGDLGRKRPHMLELLTTAKKASTKPSYPSLPLPFLSLSNPNNADSIQYIPWHLVCTNQLCLLEYASKSFLKLQTYFLPWT